MGVMAMALSGLKALSTPAANVLTGAANNPVVRGAVGQVQRCGANGLRNCSNIVASTGAVGYNAVLPPGGGGPVMSGTGQIIGS